jgi:hypothetical protein
MKAPFLQLVAGTAIAGPVTNAAKPSARPAPKIASRSEGISATHANALARDNRRAAWEIAEVVTRYWRARIDMNDAAACAQREGLPEGKNHPTLDFDGRLALVARWREAKAAQLLTPAPKAAAVLWKKAELNSNYFKFLRVDAGKVERAIEADEAFLASHPVRQTKSAEAKARTRAFKEAMRQRIREVAALRTLADDEIGPALGLRHQHIGEFCEAHGVNLGWLLEGAGEMFKRGPKLAVDCGKEVLFWNFPRLPAACPGAPTARRSGRSMGFATLKAHCAIASLWPRSQHRLRPTPKPTAN